jgi:thiosulfate/3-mercaptopyruvate sulfurtransferase
MSQLIDCYELRASLKALDNLIIFDCRYDLQNPDIGFVQYQRDHIPTAHYLNLARDLSGPHHPGKTGRHPLPDPDDLRQRLGDLGVGPDSSVVAYDDGSGAYACRLWWLLRWLGHTKVLVLDGGYQRWQSLRYPVSSSVSTPTPQTLPRRQDVTRQVNAEQVLDHSPIRKLIDVRAPSRYRGEDEPLDPVAGHIPGAQNLPFLENLTDGVFKTADDLAIQFEALGCRQTDDIVCYCGSGVTATQMIFAFIEAGFNEPALYPGSWSDWITQSDRPVVTGADHR